MKNIVFVDDEKGILDGLRRMLRGQRKEWNMTFCENAELAMKTLNNNAVDAIVSDMRMPGIDGAKLLKWVRDHHPNVIRMALSGYADSELTLESVQATHQFISKPAEPGQIQKALGRTIRIRETLADPELVKVLHGLESLPTLPDIYNELITILAKDDFTMDCVAKVIERDMALSANLLRVVNSAFFGTYGHVESPHQATMLLGIDTVKNIVLSDKVGEYFRDQGIDTSQLTALNEKAQLMGALAGRFAIKAKLDKRSQDHSQIAGLMSQLGELAAATVLKDNESVQSGLLAKTLIGGQILALWGLPDPVVEAVMFRDNPADIEEENVLPVHALYAAQRFMDETYSEEENMEAITTLVGGTLANVWLSEYVNLIERMAEPA